MFVLQKCKLSVIIKCEMHIDVCILNVGNLVDYMPIAGSGIFQ